jgi:hypothetical protein
MRQRMKEKEIRVTDILLDTGNYRTGKQDDQREAIKALIDEQKNKLVNLAKDIIENGLSPLETVMVYAVPDQKNRYIVVEGNRRVAAIKLATQPDLAADTTWHNAFKRVHKLLPGQMPKKITCKIAPSKEDAYPWIQRRHDTGLKGAGLEPWSTIASYRAHAAQGKSAPEYDALEFVLTHGQLDADVQDRVMGQDFPITNLKRLVDSAYISEQLELDKGDPALTTTASKKWMLAMLRDFITIISREEYEDHKPFAVKDIYDANDMKKFFNKLAGKHPKPARKTKRWAINANTNLSDVERGRQKQKKPKRPTSERKKLIPKNTDVLPPMGRANDILHELRRLEVEPFRNAVSVLFRVFLEFSVEEYMTRRAVLGFTAADTLAKKLRAVTKHMEDNAIMTKKDLTSANKAANDPHSMFSTVQLNAYVHNQNFYPSSSDLKTSWDNLEPFIVKLWHG